MDPVVRARIWGHLQSLTTQGVSIIITTHYIEEARDAHMVRALVIYIYNIYLDIYYLIIYVMLAGGDHEERAAACPGASRPADGAAPGPDPGEGLPQALHRDRVSNTS